MVVKSYNTFKVFVSVEINDTYDTLYTIVTILDKSVITVWLRCESESTMNWQQLRAEIDLFERETTQPEQPLRELSEVDKRIEARLKPGMDASEVDVIVDQEYKRQPRSKCALLICNELATERIMFTSGMSDNYCAKHAALFHDDLIEEREELI